MNYADAIASIIATYRDGDTIALATVMEMNALESLDPGQFTVTTDGYPLYRGRRLPGVAIDLPALLNAPGFLIQHLATDGTTAFQVSVSSMPTKLLQPFEATDIPELLGVANTAYLGNLYALISSRVGTVGLLPPDEIKRVLDLINRGIVCAPAAQSTLTNVYRGLPSSLTYPDFAPSVKALGDQSWAKIVAEFDDARHAYATGNVSNGAKVLAASNDNAALWDGIYNAVKAIRDAPAAVATAAASAAGEYASSFLTGPLIVTALIVVGVVVAALYVKGRAVASVAANVA